MYVNFVVCTYLCLYVGIFDIIKREASPSYRIANCRVIHSDLNFKKHNLYADHDVHYMIMSVSTYIHMYVLVHIQ